MKRRRHDPCPDCDGEGCERCEEYERWKLEDAIERAEVAADRLIDEARDRRCER